MHPGPGEQNIFRERVFPCIHGDAVKSIIGDAVPVIGIVNLPVMIITIERK